MNSNDAEIEAGEWLARMDREDFHPEDLAAFEGWKAGDPRRGAAYARLAATWQALDRIQAVRPPAAASIDNDYLSGALQEHRHRDIDHHAAEYSETRTRTFVPRCSSHRPWFALPLAASIFLVIAGIWVFHGFGIPQTYRTGIGGFQRIVLNDESAIELNTDSEVRVAFTDRRRSVDLVRGEASFEVAHDPSRPFIVSAGSTAVLAVGTKFDVLRLGNAVEVTVDEGKVVVGAPGLLEASSIPVSSTMLHLAAGQTVLSNNGGVTLQTLSKDGVARKLAWHSQMLVFDGDTLAQVVAQFNRYNERHLIIADPSLAHLQIGGYFRPTNLDAFTNVLQSNFGVRVTRDGNRLVLAAAESK